MNSSIDRRAGDAENLGDLARGVLTGAVQLHEVLLLRSNEHSLICIPIGSLAVKTKKAHSTHDTVHYEEQNFLLNGLQSRPAGDKTGGSFRLLF